MTIRLHVDRTLVERDEFDLPETAGAARWLMVTTLVTTGVVLLAVQYESTWGWVVLLPLCAWLLSAVSDARNLNEPGSCDSLFSMRLHCSRGVRLTQSGPDKAPIHLQRRTP